jgi:hypothetical protein
MQEQSLQADSTTYNVCRTDQTQGVRKVVQAAQSLQLAKVKASQKTCHWQGIPGEGTARASELALRWTPCSAL